MLMTVTDAKKVTGQRTVLVTGGTCGIGRAVALKLAGGGDRVLFVGRSAQRGAQVLAALRQANPAADHRFLRADLALLSDTARVAQEAMRHTDRLHAAVFCAGQLALVPDWTSEQLERTFVLNYLSRHLLARLLLPLLVDAPSGRLVLVANAGKYGDSLDFDDLQHRRGKPGLKVSGRTQFANDLLAVELAERLRGTRVEVTCVFPGLVRTGVFRNASGLPPIVRMSAPLLQRLVAISPEAAARTPVYLAQDPGAVGISGHFFGPDLASRPVPAHVQQKERRAKLWAVSEDLVWPYLPKGRATDHASILAEAS
jgi:NAD(P)-dependent dehydrogenase (short-subunit alcohol dehydrogenase family)